MSTCEPRIMPLRAEIVKVHDNLDMLLLWPFEVNVTDKTPFAVYLLNAPRLKKQVSDSIQISNRKKYSSTLT